MKGIDREAVESRLMELDENVHRLKKTLTMPLEDYLSDTDEHYIVQRCLQVAIQCCLDIGNHVISAMSYERPADYGEIFHILGRHGVIPKELADRMRPLGGLRNILVHNYMRVNIELLRKQLEHLNDFREFAKHISALLLRKE